MSFCQKCCNPACSVDPNDSTGYTILARCGNDVQNGLFDIVDRDCLETVTQTFPFGHILDGQLAAFEFTNSEALIGNGSFRGKIDKYAGGTEKVILRLISLANSMDSIEK